MNPRSVLTVSLLTVLFLASCAPTEAPIPTPTEAPAQPAVPITEDPQLPSPTNTAVTVAVTEAPPTEAPTEVPQPIATSRGPDLEATDPTTVSLNSGELQLVEFFRFT
jgi:hypothetical protein